MKKTILIFTLFLTSIFIQNLYSQSDLNLNGFYLEANEGVKYYQYNDTSNWCIIDTNKVLGFENIVKVKKNIDVYNNFSLLITFDKIGKENFAKATKENIGKKIAFIFNNKIIMAPTITMAITGGKAQITSQDSKMLNEIYKILKKDIKARKKKK